jgi:protein arginine N-methyltransferase 5
VLDSDEAKLEADYLDALQRPLQPLRDHLEFNTYEVFEKDPVKYERYQQAMRLALAAQQKAMTVFVVRAGRGPLVTCTLQAFRELSPNWRACTIVHKVDRIIEWLHNKSDVQRSVFAQ